MDGFLNILKPPGMSSGDMVFQARRLLPRGTRVGHGGTLDPDAAGVLPVCVGRAARLFDYIIDKQKTYIAELRLGVVTDTQDASGTVLERRDASTVTEADVRAVLPRFTGTISQIPPMYSALKRGGQKLCDLARRGESLELEPRPVTIHAIEYIGRRDETAHLLRQGDVYPHALPRHRRGAGRGRAHGVPAAQRGGLLRCAVGLDARGAEGRR